MPTYPLNSAGIAMAIRERKPFNVRSGPNLWGREYSPFDKHAARIHRWLSDAARDVEQRGDVIDFTVFSYATAIGFHVTPADGSPAYWLIDSSAHSMSTSRHMSRMRTALGGYGWIEGKLHGPLAPLAVVDTAAHAREFYALTAPQRAALSAIATGNPAADKPHPRVLANLIEKGLVQWHAFHETRPEWTRKLVLTRHAADMFRALGSPVNLGRVAAQ